MVSFIYTVMLVLICMPLATNDVISVLLGWIPKLQLGPYHDFDIIFSC